MQATNHNLSEARLQHIRPTEHMRLHPESLAQLSLAQQVSLSRGMQATKRTLRLWPSVLSISALSSAARAAERAPDSRFLFVSAAPSSSRLEPSSPPQSSRDSSYSTAGGAGWEVIQAGMIRGFGLSLERITMVGVRPDCCVPSRAFAAVRAQKIQVPKKKRRLDEVCLERFQQYSRTYIQSWILQGKVHVDGRVVNKAGTQVSDKSVIEIKAEIPKYVCRAGHKLEAAIKEFGINCDGKIALDSGLSTGGFTDCLLQHGASHVYGVDVGYGQVAEKIRVHECVSVIERTNLRYLSELPQLVDLVTLDLSFISILLVMPAVTKVMKADSILITLIKPQFEARRSQVGGGGIVRDPLVHQEVLDRIISGVEEFGFSNKGWIESPIKGAEGNKEFLACFHRVPTAELGREAEAEVAAT